MNDEFLLVTRKESHSTLAVLRVAPPHMHSFFEYFVYFVVSKISGSPARSAHWALATQVSVANETRRCAMGVPVVLLTYAKSRGKEE